MNELWNKQMSERSDVLNEQINERTSRRVDELMNEPINNKGMNLQAC